MDFKLIKGGLVNDDPARYNFISAQITDTRLMGVVAMHACWEDLRIPGQFFWQFYYFDYEELGLETLTLFRTDGSTDDSKILSDMVKENTAGLGGELMPLTEKETAYMVQFFVSETKRKKQPLPPLVSEIEYLIANPDRNIPAVKISLTEQKALQRLICTQIKSDYGAINYYLMRMFGKDTEGAKYLISPSAKASDFDELPFSNHCTFLRNKITACSENSGPVKLFRCEILLERDADAEYSLVVMQTGVYRRKIVSQKCISSMTISLFEASMLLNRTEFVSTYNLEDTDSFGKFLTEFAGFSVGMTHTENEGGTMFLDFYPDNNHAEKKLFVLNNDIRTMYFISAAGQLAVTAYNMNEMINSDIKLMKSSLSDYFVPVGSYRFSNSIIYDYAESGYPTLEEYLADIE